MQVSDHQSLFHRSIPSINATISSLTGFDQQSMDETESIDQSELQLGSKRPLQGDVEVELANKKARGDCEVRLGDNVKKVAEIVLVLATMGKMRGGRKPTPVEVKMMAEAREKLAEICKEFAPKDVFPVDAFGTIIEDLGLNRLGETKLGIRPQKLSIVQKLQLTKQKMEKSEVFPVHSAASYTPRVTEPLAASHAVRTFPSGKADHVPVSSGSLQHRSTVVHASSVSNSRTLPFQLPTSEVRPVGSNVLTSSHLGRHSTASPIEQAGRPPLRSDERSNANSAGDHKTSSTPIWPIQFQSASFDKTGLNKGPTHLTNINHHVQHRMNFVQAPATDTHKEVSKIVQKILQPDVPELPTWIPPPRDYMNKALTCQTCKNMINEVDTILICDACEKGYHLRCLQCNLKAIFGDEQNDWHCAKCLVISNGKPIPPKYGRVMRNVNTPKMPASSAGVQPSLEKKVQSSDENFSQHLMSANGISGSQRSTDIQKNGTHECGIEKFPSEKCQSNQALENQKDDNKEKMVSVTDVSSKPLTQNGINSEGNSKGDFREVEEVVEKGDFVKTTETSTAFGENKGFLSSSMRDVEWVGDVMNEVDGKIYYQSCCISGTTYQVQDYALFSSDGSNLMPNKLQGMWEDKRTNKKWVTVTRCFFPDDLPEGVGRPCAPEGNEVYESNHETTLAAGLIHGPCQLLPPRKFSEERVMQTHSETTAGAKPKPLFLCKWFYDEKKRVFRDVSCVSTTVD